jgi:hypothetical protein
MQPPTHGTPSSKALFWFLAWHKSKFNEPFTFTTQKKITKTTKISKNAISRIIKNPPV